MHCAGGEQGNSPPALFFNGAYWCVAGTKEIIITREPYSSYVTLKFQDGTSDKIQHRDAARRLEREGVKDPEKVLDHVWNFYRAKVVINIP